MQSSLAAAFLYGDCAVDGIVQFLDFADLAQIEATRAGKPCSDGTWARLAVRQLQPRYATASIETALETASHVDRDEVQMLVVALGTAVVANSTPAPLPLPTLAVVRSAVSALNKVEMRADRHWGETGRSAQCLIGALTFPAQHVDGAAEMPCANRLACAMSGRRHNGEIGRAHV